MSPGGCGYFIIVRNDGHFVKGFQSAGSGRVCSPVLFAVNRRPNVFETDDTLGISPQLACWVIHSHVTRSWNSRAKRVATPVFYKFRAKRTYVRDVLQVLTRGSILYECPQQRAQRAHDDVNKQEVSRYINEFPKCVTQIITTGKLNTIKRKQFSLETEFVSVVWWRGLHQKGNAFELKHLVFLVTNCSQWYCVLTFVAGLGLSTEFVFLAGSIRYCTDWCGASKLRRILIRA